MATLTRPDLKPKLGTLLPGLYLILAPDFTVVAVSNDYLQVTSLEKEVILGRIVFDVFPNDLNDKDATSIDKLRDSLNTVLRLGEPHKMAEQKYNIPKPDGGFEERYLAPLNTPVFNKQNELVYIIYSLVDVTTQKRISNKLKKSERDFQLLVSSVKDYAIFMIGLDGCVASWNSGAESIKGYAAAEIIGKPIDVFYTNEDIKLGVPQTNLQIAMLYGYCETDGWRVRKDGSLFWASIVITALRDEDGGLYGYSKITRDITERKKAQDQVESLSRLINQSNDAIYTIDAGFKIKSWNNGAQKLYGYTREEVIGKDSNTILRTALDQEKISTVVKEIAEKDYWSGEIKRKTKDDRDIYVHSSSTTIRDHTGAITGYTVVSHDITEQKRLREQVNHLANIVEQSSEAIISKGVDLRIISWNRGAEILFGFSKEEAIGKTAKELGMIKLTDEEIAESGKQIFATGSWKSEMQCYHKNGASFFGAIAANVVGSANGEITSLVFIIKDISLHKQLEEQLKKHNDELEEKVKSRTEHIIKTEKRFKALTDSSHDVITMVDENLNVFYRSPSTTRITGWTNEDMINTEALKNIHPDDVEMAKQITKEVLANPGKPVNCLARNQHKDGHYLWLEGAVINLLHDENVKAIVFSFRDVTERIAAEEKVIANEKRFRALIENNNEVVLLLDESLKVLYRSPSASRITGWAHEEIIGMDGSKNIHPDDLNIARGVLKDLLADPGKPINCIFRSSHKDGRYLWLEGIAVNLMDDKNVRAIVFNFRDVTERINAEEKVIANEKRFRALIENNNDVISLLDESFKVFYRSPSASRITGWTNEELIDLNGTKNIHPDDIDIAKGIVKDLMANPGKPINCLFRNLHKDGRYLWLEGVAVNLLHDENVKAIVFNFRDVTERISAKEKLMASERRFRSLIENNNELIILTDASFKIIYRSPSADRITGWTDKEMNGIVLTKKVHPGDREKVADIYEECLANPGKHINISYRINNKKGECLHMEGVMTNLLHEEHVNAIVLNLREVTERIEAEEKLKASEKQYRTTLNNMLEGVQILDFDWKYIYVNDALVISSKYSREELVGHTMMEKYPGVEQSALFKTLKRCMVKRKAHKFENEFVYPDGTKACFELSVQPVPEGIFILSIDITERKNAEATLKEEQDKFTKIAAASPGLIFAFRMESGGLVSFPFASSAFEEIFGVQYETVANDVSVIINASYQQDKELLISSITASASNMSPWQLQFRYHHPKKGIVWLEGHSIPTADTDGSILWYGVITDVTERKVAEDKINEQNLRLKSLSDNLPGMMFYQLAGDAFENRKFSYVSSGVTALTGKTPEEIIDNPASLYSLIVEEDAKGMRAAEIEAYNTMTPFNVEIRCRDFKGNTHWLNIISTPRRLNNGEIVWDGLHLDITEKKIAEQQREFDANNLAALINNTHDLIWSVDRNFNLITSNEAFNKLVYHITGKKMEKGINIFLPQFDEQQQERYKRYYQRAFAGEIFTEIEHNSIKDFWFEISFYPMFEGNTVIGIASFSRNITEKKKSEEEIRKANERFELVVAATNDVIWDWDIITNKLWRNRNYYSHFGYDEKTIPGDTSAWHNGIHPDDKKRVLSGVDECIKSKRNFWTDEYRYLKADKTIAYILDCGYILYTENGKAYRMVGAMLDITARKQAEQELKKSFDEKQVLAERLSIILNTLPANIALLDGDGYIIDVNDAWRNFADTNELSGSNYCIGQNYADISINTFGEVEGDRIKVARGIKAVLKNKLKEFVYEYPCDSLQIKRWFRMIVTPLQGAEKAGAVVMHIDISEVRRMEEERLKAKIDEQKKITKAMLMGQEKERNHLGEELHDNINQILAGTKLYLSIAGNKNEELKDLIKYPMELIDSSIDEIRVLCHKMVSPLKNVGLEKLIGDIIKKIEETTTIKTEFIYTLPKGILSDDLKLNIYRIIQELVSNIVKYAGANNVKIIMQSDEKTIDITVTDDGAGFDMSQKRKGIGISNIINRVSSFNGEIKIDSAAGKGCKTSITIPVK